MKPEEIDDIFNDPNYEYGEPGEFSQDLPITKEELNIHRDTQSIKQAEILQDSIDIYTDTMEGTVLEASIEDKFVSGVSKSHLWVKGQSGNPKGKPKREKNKNITGLVEERLSKKAEAIKFVNRWFDLFYDTNNKQATTAGQMIWERHEGKVKDVLQISAIVEHIPDQAEALKIANAFRVDQKPEKVAELTQ
jgi:hypothetical protein